MKRALCVSVQADNRNYLLDYGYVRALERSGWQVHWMSHQDAGKLHSLPYDLIIWDLMAPESFLRKVSPSQLLILRGGAGDDISHYERYADKISLLTTSFFYKDEPLVALDLRHFSPFDVIGRPKQYWWIFKYMRRFPVNASPARWRRAGIKFIYLPFASDWEMFHPIPGAKTTARWSFCGEIRWRPFVKTLMAESDRRGWEYEVHAPETKSVIPPEELNSLYNRATFGVNEQHLITFGRELNQRTFDLGMSGCLQITDMEWLSDETLGGYAKFYASKIHRAEDRPYGIKLMAETEAANRDEVHEFFRKHHSFEARLATISKAIGVDLGFNSSRLTDQNTCSAVACTE